MSSEWTWLYEETKSIALNISATSYEELLEYLERRETIMSRLQENESVPMEEIPSDFNLLEFNQWNQIIMEKLIELKNEANDKLAEISAKRNIKASYETYSTQTSYFFDSKK
jgi:hypothetical protein